MAVMRPKIYILVALLISVLFMLLSCCMNAKLTSVTAILNTYSPSVSYSNQFDATSSWKNGWQPIGHSYDEQIRLRNMSTIVATWLKTAEDNVPTVPCLSADGYLLVLSVAASRVRYGVSLTFVTVYPTDVKIVLPKNISSNPRSAYGQSLWCIFDDGSVTPIYSYNSKYGNERVSLLDCSLSPFASNQLWKHNQTLRVYLASTTDKDRNAPILKAFINVPMSPVSSQNTSQESFTLCTSPLHNKANYLTQWIEFHRLVGFHKFVIYNTSDADNHLFFVLSTYARKYTGLVDIVQWNFSTLGLVDILPTRYFQTEALHDCLIRYGDNSEWLGMLDLDEYIVPLYPYKTVPDYIYDKLGRRIVGSLNLWSQFFCTKYFKNFTTEEDDKSRLTFERFTFRARQLHKKGHEKYLYRPRFVQYLSIHHQLIGLSKQKSSENHIILAHYPLMTRLRTVPGCNTNQSVKDTSVRDRFANQIRKAIMDLMVKH